MPATTLLSLRRHMMYVVRPCESNQGKLGQGRTRPGFFLTNPAESKKTHD